MHDLFALVLNKKDLSKAGDLFSLEDKDIENDLTEVLTKIRQVVANKDYLQNDNDQSVIEICTTRVTSAVRENRSIERHAVAMVALLETCLDFNLKPTFRDADTPHAKVASEILSCIFMNYSKKGVMELALPIAVKFLGQGNKELCRNMTSYLSLAAIDNAHTLAANIQPVIDSIVAGNTMLVRILPQVYSLNRGPVDQQVARLISLLPECDQSEKNSLIQLFGLAAKSQPRLLEAHISQLCNYLSSPVTSALVLQVFVDMAAVNPMPFASHVTSLKHTVDQQPGTLALAARVLGPVGAECQSVTEDCLAFLVQQLSNADAATLSIVLLEIYHIGVNHTILLPDHLTEIVKYQQTAPVTACITIQQIRDLCLHKSIFGSRGGLSPDRRTAWSQTEGVTVITVGNPSYPSRSMSQALGASSSHMLPHTNLPTSKNASTSTREISYPAMLPYSSGSVIGSSSMMLGSNGAMIGSNHKVSSNGLLSSSAMKGLGASQHSGLMHMGGERSGMSHTSVASSQPLRQQMSSIHSLRSSQQTLPNSRSSQPVLASQQTLKASQQTLKSSQMMLPSSSQMLPSGSQMLPNSSQVLPTSSQQTLPTKLQSNIMSASSPPHYPASLLNTQPNSHMNTVHKPVSKYPHYGTQTSMPQPITYQHHMAAHHTLPSHPAQHHNQIPGRMTQSQEGQPAPPYPQPQKSQTLPQPLHATSVTTPTFTQYGPQTGHRSRPTSGTHNPPTITNTYTGQPVHTIPHRDAVQQFCEKHLDKIKTYIDNAKARLPIPVKATLQEVKQKKYCVLNFICAGQEDNCLYNKKFFTMRTKNARVWIHLMFLAIQARSEQAVCQQDPSVGNLKALWDTYKLGNGNGFVHLVTSSFPSTRDQEHVLHELFNNRYFDVFDFNAAHNYWACFLCNHPEKVTSLMQDGNPTIQGQLKEKKGRWKFLKRWKTRYFTLSGSAITYNKKDMRKETLPINKVQSVKAVRKGMRDIPKAFELFTNDQSYIFKVENGQNAEQWVQCLQIAVARSQKDEVSEIDTGLAWSQTLLNNTQQQQRPSQQQPQMQSQQPEPEVYSQTKL